MFLWHTFKQQHVQHKKVDTISNLNVCASLRNTQSNTLWKEKETAAFMQYVIVWNAYVQHEAAYSDGLKIALTSCGVIFSFEHVCLCSAYFYILLLNFSYRSREGKLPDSFWRSDWQSSISLSVEKSDKWPLNPGMKRLFNALTDYWKGNKVMK